MFFAVKKNPRFFIKRIVNIEDILENGVQNNLPRKQVVANLMREGLSKSLAYKAHQHFNQLDSSKEESVKAIKYLCMVKLVIMMIS